MAVMESNPNNPASTSKSELSADDILDALNVDDAEPDTDLLANDDKVPVKTGKSDSKDDKETEDKKDDTEEVEEVPEDLELTADDLITPVRRKEILAKFPDLFKTFPYLEKAMYREQQYTEILPSIEDAKIALDKSNRLDQFENSVLAGTTADVLKSVKETDTKAFNKIVDNYLEDLRKVDSAGYAHVISSTIKQLVSGMVGEARRINNEDLGKAAVILNQFMFGKSEFTPQEKFAKDDVPNPEAEQLKSERAQFAQQRLGATVSDLGTKADNAIKSTITNHIDPKNLMTPYVRRNAINDAMQEVNKLIQQDTRFQSMKDKLWERAMQANFSKDSTDTIRNAYLSYAKTVLPSAIKKARNEALKGTGKSTSEDINESRDRKASATTGRSPSPSSDRSNKADGKIPRGMSTLDFLNSD